MSGIGQELLFAARRLARSPALQSGRGADAGARDRRQRRDLRSRPARRAQSAALSRLGPADRARPRRARASTCPPASGSRPASISTTPNAPARSRAPAIYRTDDLTLTGDGEPGAARRCTSATPSLAAVLRVAPALGRWFTEEEGRPGAPPVAVLSHGLWTRRFGATRHPRPAVMLDGVPTEIVGVMPASFAFPGSARRRVDRRATRASDWASGCGTTAAWHGCATARRSTTRAPSCTA